MPDIQTAVNFMVQIANDDSHGYDQTHRNGPDYDCSSLVATALNKAGFNVSVNSWTGNLESQLRKCGFVDCTAPWKAGDVHIKTGHHVCMSINTAQIAHASINENGGVTGGKTGDQTGKEICIRNYYEYAGGWSCHLRYPTKESKSVTEVAKEVIGGKWGNGTDRKSNLEKAGYNYVEVQSMVNSILRGEKKTQLTAIAHEVIAGKWGNYPERKTKLEKAGYNYTDVQLEVNRLLGH